MTLYAVTARFRDGVADQRDALHMQFSDHMRQPLLHIRLVGRLNGLNGGTEGILMLMEADGRRTVEHFLEQSPYHQAGLYDRIEIEEFAIEAGGLN